MTEYLNECGYQINRQRVSRLMGELGLRMIYPGPTLSAPGKDSKKYPYLLRDLEVTCPNQVWSTDITYIRMPGGFVELTVMIDWESRYVFVLEATLHAVSAAFASTPWKKRWDRENRKSLTRIRAYSTRAIVS